MVINVILLQTNVLIIRGCHRVYYHPFGMQIKERSWSSSEYRFGFNGQETDDEVSGTGNSYTAQFWQYDCRLGRRWNSDPLETSYAWQSPYSVFNSNPLFFIDPLGLEGEPPKGRGTRKANRKANKSMRQLAKKGITTEKSWDPENQGFKLNITSINQSKIDAHSVALSDESSFFGLGVSGKVLNASSQFYNGLVKGGNNLRKSTEHIINSTVDGDLSPLFNAVSPPIGMEIMDISEDNGTNIPTTWEEAGEAAFGIGTVLLTKGKKKYFRDYSTPKTKPVTYKVTSERTARNMAWNKLGKNPVKVDDYKFRSADGQYQFRAKPGDVKAGHIHLEKLNSDTGEVLENWHLEW